MISPPGTHVHLDHNRSPNLWRQRWQRGQVFEEWPYGYQHAAARLPLTYSIGHPESRAVELVRRALTRVLGFDLIHTWRNRRELARAEVVWTHTEREHLALGLLIRLRVVGPAVKVVAQSIWLWDRWDRLPRWRRALYRWLLEPLTLHTTHSRANLAVAGRALPGRVALVPYGTRQLDRLSFPDRPVGRAEVRVVAPGNDVDRDWSTLIAAADHDPALRVTILTRRSTARRLDTRPNVTVRVASGSADLLQAYAAADVVVVPLLENRHASGITVALEGLNVGRPVVVSRTGGLSDYLGETVDYVEPGCAAELASALRRAAEQVTAKRIDAAREHVIRAGLTEVDFAGRHVLLTEALVSGSPVPTDTSAFAPVPVSRPG